MVSLQTTITIILSNSSQGPAFFNSQGRVNIDSGGGGIYATYFQHGFYLNGFAGGAYASYDFRRSVNVSGTNSGSTGGGNSTDLLEPGSIFADIIGPLGRSVRSRALG